jgi:hypothetical protein
MHLIVFNSFEMVLGEDKEGEGVLTADDLADDLADDVTLLEIAPEVVPALRGVAAALPKALPRVVPPLLLLPPLGGEKSVTSSLPLSS